MKATGIVRKVDELGRIVLPSELRRLLNVQVKDSFELFIEGDLVILKKYEPGCIFTNEMGDLIEYHGKRVSKIAIEEMAKAVGIIE